MLVAQKKQQENIAEYVLYLFQIEDIVRSLNFDIEQIMEAVVKPNLPDSSFEGQYRSWYADIIKEMKRSGLEKKGHLDRVMEVMKELLFLHNTLFAIQGESKYKQLCANSSSFTAEFREKASMKNQHDVEILIHAMHMSKVACSVGIVEAIWRSSRIYQPCTSTILGTSTNHQSRKFLVARSRIC